MEKVYICNRNTKNSMTMMRKTLFVLWAVCSLTAWALVPPAQPAAPLVSDQNAGPEIRFDSLRADLGTFSESQPERICSFVFTNIGSAPLVINQAIATCGCTVATYTKTPVKPGEKGRVDVAYNGKGRFPGKFSKTITVRSNAKTEIVRLTIEGTMTK